MSASDTGRLASNLGYRFQTPRLLEQALTHKSREGRPSYERLEFLGDRVLGLVVARLLYERFPAEDEGALARRHGHLVSQETVARVAIVLDLGAVMRLSPGDDHAGARRNPSLLCDVCEAVLGAVFLDGGLDEADRIITELWTPLILEDATPPRAPKTALQEWAQERGLPLPEYLEEQRDGPPHRPVFTVRVAVKGRGSARAQGSSKRVAEQEAARLLLERLEQNDE
ncbi:ribonuclease III [Phaeovibrio sulfidiphilus]|uniref:Ribonuclease 3 n=1 Tax=Phaeovibrio sulfidiphilus TaxID=1220600 RepID=A0A8J6YKS8_9PROT|nr:ribonuclease III [Phaeovibrio sulfidiphilus]MBE1236268.1 ribonuclease III [Phaeovibrio sulfidiphilus]